MKELTSFLGLLVILISSCIDQNFGDTQIKNGLSIDTPLKPEIGSWNFIKNTNEFNKDVLALEMLAIKIAEKVPAEMETAKISKYLEMYIATRSKSLSFYSSQDKFLSHLTYILDRNKSKDGFIWYDTGAAVAYMLDMIGISMENEIKEGKTFFEIAQTELSMSGIQIEERLQQAQNEFDWSAIQMRAEQFVNSK